MTRPDEAPLPTSLDPAGPEAKGYPADPKPVPKRGAGRPERQEPRPGRHRPVGVKTVAAGVRPRLHVVRYVRPRSRLSRAARRHAGAARRAARVAAADPDVHAALAAAIASGAWGQYHGEHVCALEAELAAFHDVPHALTCASGTLAVEAALRRSASARATKS